MHQCEQNEQGPRAYIVELQPSVIKVGYSANANSRLMSYPNHLRCAVSPIHANALETEAKLKGWCRSNGKLMIGRECFSGITFEKIVDFAGKLFDEYREQEVVSSNDVYPILELIHPRSREFYPQAHDEISRERARGWALDGHYLLVKGSLPTNCAHGFYMLTSCPNSCRKFGFDHTNMWIEDRERGVAKAFLLTQPYHEDPKLAEYAEAHGLEYRSYNYRSEESGSDYYRGFDNWYSDKIIAIRLSIGNDWPLWPIEREVATMLSVSPVRWRDVEGRLR